MRKFTKGLLMTLVASAVSVGAFGQSEPINGYFRVVNCGYAWNSVIAGGETPGFGEGVMQVTAPTTAQPTAGSDDMLTLPGTVMYIDATPMSENPETSAQYVDVNPNDLIVNNLRSQAVDAAAAIYAPLVETVKKFIFQGVRTTNLKKDWGLSEDEINTIIDEMFYYMQMFLEPIENYTSKEGWEADGTLYYLKSTTPNLQPLLDALSEKGFEFTGRDELWGIMMAETMQYYDDNGMDQAKAEWDFFTKRIHLGHTYYLIGGRVTPNFATGEQTFEAYPNGSAQISFANANKYYGNMDPEIEVADMYAVWELVPVTTEKEDEEAPDTYFAVKNGVKGLDGHYYTTGYFDFPFQAEEGVRVWGINELFAPKAFQSTEPANSLVAYVLPTEYTGTVPAHTPVVIENATGNDVAILQPVDEPADEGEASLMKGIFFDATFDATSTEPSDDDSFEYYELPLDKETTTIYRKDIRVFNRTDNPLHKNNPLGFFKYTGKATNQTVKANKGWMDITDVVPTATENEGEAEAGANVIIVDAATFAALTDGITEVNKAEKSSNVVYDIQGRIVSNPTKGLYIVNGKKVIK